MSTTQPDIYGNIIKPGRSGILGLSMGLSLLGVPFVLVIVLMLVRQWYWQSLIVVLVGVVSIALAAHRSSKDGMNFYERRFLRMAQRQKVRSGNAVYLAGPAGRVPDGKIRLPGLLAPSELSEHPGAYDAPFGLIRLRGPKHYTVVLECHPDGDALVDQVRVNSMVAHWGAWMAGLGRDDGIIVCVGDHRDVARLRAPPNSHDAEQHRERRIGLLAQRRLRHPGADSRRVAADHDSHRDHVLRQVPRQGRIGPWPRGHGDEIGTRLPALMSTLFDTGAGTSIRACTAQDIIDFTRTAYDPTVASQVEQARAEGGTGLTWEDAGPVYASDAHLDRYVHDRAVSKSWTMFEGPRGQFYSNALKSLMQPVQGVLRKRVTIMYRPIPAGEATAVVESAVNDATFAGSQRQRTTARQAQKLAFAKKAAEEEARGAGLVRFGMIVTVSCADASEFPPPREGDSVAVEPGPSPGPGSARQPGRLLPGWPPPRCGPPGALRDPRFCKGADLMGARSRRTFQETGQVELRLSRREARSLARRADRVARLQPRSTQEGSWLSRLRQTPLRAVRRPRGARAVVAGREGHRPRELRAAEPGVPGHHGAGVRPLAVHRRQRLPGHRGAARPSPAQRQRRVRGPDLLVPREPRAEPVVLRPRTSRPGKSTIVRRMVTVLEAWGIVPMVLSDTKPDYVDLITAMEGQVIRVGRGRGHLNPLDLGPLMRELEKIPTRTSAAKHSTKCAAAV